MLLQSYVEDNGNLTLVADPNTLRKDILQLDLNQAHRQTQLTASLMKQVRSDVVLLIVVPAVTCTPSGSQFSPAVSHDYSWPPAYMSNAGRSAC